MNLPNLSAINEEAWKLYHAHFDNIPGGASQRLYHQECIKANSIRDAYLKRHLVHLFERQSNRGRYMAYRLVGTNHIFLIQRNRGRKDIRSGLLATDETLSQHWMNWQYMGDMSGVGGLFLSGLKRLYGQEAPNV